MNIKSLIKGVLLGMILATVLLALDARNKRIECVMEHGLKSSKCY